jgi:hypothetical protein
MHYFLPILSEQKNPFKTIVWQLVGIGADVLERNRIVTERFPFIPTQQLI